MAQQASVLTTPFGFTGASLLPTLTLLISMVAGTMFGIWLGQLISEFGIPNQGLSLIIFAGIISRIPTKLAGILADQDEWLVDVPADDCHSWLDHFCHRLCAARTPQCAGAVPWTPCGQPHVHAGTQQPALMVNMAGMIPLIFAQTFLSFPALIASYFIKGRTEGFFYSDLSNCSVEPEYGWIYPVIYFVLVVAFTFFYTDVLFTQQNYGDTLKKQGAQIPGVVRGGPTQKYLTKVQRRITFPGAFFLGFVAVLPYILEH